MDLPEAAARLDDFRRRAGECRGGIYPISALTGSGVKELVYALCRALEQSG